MKRDELGRLGERVAARYYIQQGYTLLEHNYRVRFGEIDLILRDPEGDLVVCEVKTRSNPNPVCLPSASVTKAKQRKLVRVTSWYLQEAELYDVSVRFDVAEVTPIANGHWLVHIIKQAFAAT